MNQPGTKTDPMNQPESRSVLKHEFLTLMGTILGIGVALSVFLHITTDRIESRIDTTNSRIDNIATRIENRLDAAIAAAAADRRSFQASMDEFRGHMQRLGERQARLEGQRNPGAAQ